MPFPLLWCLLPPFPGPPHPENRVVMLACSLVGGWAVLHSPPGVEELGSDPRSAQHIARPWTCHLPALSLFWGADFTNLWWRGARELSAEGLHPSPCSPASALLGLECGAAAAPHPASLRLWPPSPTRPEVPAPSPPECCQGCFQHLSGSTGPGEGGSRGPRPALLIP